MATFSNKPWSKPTVSDFGGDAARYCASCMIDSNPTGQPKRAENCHLPYKEASGAVNVNALRAIMAVLGGARGGVQASSADKAAARSKCQGLLAQARSSMGSANK